MPPSYPDFRTYGKPPYEVVVVHGGPGAPGEMAPVAERLSAIRGVLEPLQKASSVDGQVFELYEVIRENCVAPIVLIGWSWGAMLSFIFAAQYPELVKKLILLNSGPFESIYAKDIMTTRLARLGDDARTEIKELNKKLADPDGTNKARHLKRFAQIIFEADSYRPIVSESTPLEYQYDLHQKVWEEVTKLRDKGQLLGYASSLTCPVVAIHGDFDPRPFLGVQDPLSRRLKKFRSVLIENCGHYPWFEELAAEAFFGILQEEITFNDPAN